MVDRVFSEEDAERFYREESKNKWYRESLARILEHEIKRLALEEEELYTDQTNSVLLNSIAQRKALRKLSTALRNNTYLNRGE